MHKSARKLMVNAAVLFYISPFHHILCGQEIDKHESKENQPSKGIKQSVTDLINTSKDKFKEIDESESMKILKDKTEEAKNYISKKKGDRTSNDNRNDKKWSLLVTPISFGWFLPKKGLQMVYQHSSDFSFEPEYLNGSFEIKLFKVNFASFSEQIFTLPFRSYFGNSFNLKYGLGKRQVNFSIGDELLDDVTGGNNIFYDELIEIESYIIDFGLGNRWQFDNGFTMGADWANIFIPITANVKDNISHLVKNEDDKELVKKAIQGITNFPSITFFKLQFGYSF